MSAERAGAWIAIVFVGCLAALSLTALGAVVIRMIRWSMGS